MENTFGVLSLFPFDLLLDPCELQVVDHTEDSGRVLVIALDDHAIACGWPGEELAPCGGLCGLEERLGDRWRTLYGRTPHSKERLHLHEVSAKQSEQHFVLGALILRVILEAVALEVLHQVCLTVLRVLLVEWLGYRIAIDTEAALISPVAEE